MNKRLVLGLFLLLAVAYAQMAYAQGAAPAMTNVREILVQYARFNDPKAADICGLGREVIAKTLMDELAASNVPAISAATAKPPMMGVARIELVPEISTISNQTLDCTSWISLTAQSQSNVKVPPVDLLRNVRIVYWQQGALTATGQVTHADQVKAFLAKMAQQFAKQYRIDQPPSLPTPGTTP